MPENQIEKFLSKIYGAATLYGLQGSGKTLVLMMLMNARHERGAEIYTNQMGINGFETHPIRSVSDLEFALKDERYGIMALDEAHEIMDSRSPMATKNRTTGKILALSRKHKKLVLGATQFTHLLDKRFKDHALWQIFPVTYANVKGHSVPTIGTWDLKPEYMTLEVYKRNVNSVLVPYATGSTRPLIRGYIPDYVFDLWDHHASTYEWGGSKHEKDIKKHQELIRACSSFLNSSDTNYKWYACDEHQRYPDPPTDIIGVNGGRVGVFVDVLGVSKRKIPDGWRQEVNVSATEKHWPMILKASEDNEMPYYITFKTDEVWEFLRLDGKLVKQIGNKSNTKSPKVLRKAGVLDLPIG